MTYFKLNYKSLEKAITDYKNFSELSEEDINDIFLSLENIDDAWNDSHSKAYIQTLKKHKYKITTYYNEMKELYSEIEMFKDGLNKIIFKYLNIKNISNIEYNDANISLVISKLKKIYSYLSKVLIYLEECIFDNNYEVMQYVNALTDSVVEVKRNVKNIINNLSDMKSSINRLIENSSKSIKNKSNISLEIEPLKYNWHVNYENNNY